MTASFGLDVLGVRVSVDLAEVLDDHERERVAAAWSGALSVGAGPVDTTVTARKKASFESTMERLSIDVTLAALALVGDRALMFHAAGVADERGRVAAFVGPSGRGKTTLSRALGERYGYVSDETIAVESDLTVRPYRKPLSVVREGEPKEQVSPASAGLNDLPDASLSLSALVLIERDAALDAPEVLSIPLIDAIPQLVPQMSYLKEQDAPLQAIARLCDAVGGVQLLRYPDASAVPTLVSDLIDHVAANSEWQAASVPASGAPYDASSAVDAIITDGRVIVMVNSIVHVLDGVAPSIWLAASDGHDLDDIVLAVVAQHGEPADGSARELVAAAVDELVSRGVLLRR